MCARSCAPTVELPAAALRPATVSLIALIWAKSRTICDQISASDAETDAPQVGYRMEPASTPPEIVLMLKGTLVPVSSTRPTDPVGGVVAAVAASLPVPTEPSVGTRWSVNRGSSVLATVEDPVTVTMPDFVDEASIWFFGPVRVTTQAPLCHCKVATTMGEVLRASMFVARAP